MAGGGEPLGGRDPQCAPRFARTGNEPRSVGCGTLNISQSRQQGTGRCARKAEMIATELGQDAAASDYGTVWGGRLVACCQQSTCTSHWPCVEDAHRKHCSCTRCLYCWSRAAGGEGVEDRKYLARNIQGRGLLASYGYKIRRCPCKTAAGDGVCVSGRPELLEEQLVERVDRAGGDDEGALCILLLESGGRLVGSKGARV